jgi:hypothetical protein
MSGSIAAVLNDVLDHVREVTGQSWTVEETVSVPVRSWSNLWLGSPRYLYALYRPDGGIQAMPCAECGGGHKWQPAAVIIGFCAGLLAAADAAGMPRSTGYIYTRPTASACNR